MEEYMKGTGRYSECDKGETWKKKDRVGKWYERYERMIKTDVMHHEGCV